LQGLRTLAPPLLLTALVAAVLFAVGTGETDPTEFRQVHDLEAGTCFWRQHLDAEAWGVVRVVPCDGAWQFQVVNRFWLEAPDGATYPDSEWFEAELARGCEAGWTTYLIPTFEGWRVGDRSAWCFHERGVGPGSSTT
jgi:hypothetical protein